MSNKLVISGYGWLAGYLDRALSSDFQLTATSRSEDKLSELSKRGVRGIKYALGDDTSSLCQAVEGATFILNIPPGRKNTALDEFTHNMLSLNDDVVKANAKHIIFVSTTSVYGDTTDAEISETTATSPETASARAHVAIETHLNSSHSHVPYTIVRLAGLVGPDRHPVRSLSGRTLDAGNKRVNLVHVADVVKALEVITVKGGKNATYHLCSDLHPKRGEYYVNAAKAIGVTPPHFSDTEKPPVGKYVNARNSWSELNITPAYSDPHLMY